MLTDEVGTSIHLLDEPCRGTFFRQFCTLITSNSPPAKTICLTVFPLALSRLR
jgi:hypothetical protein